MLTMGELMLGMGGSVSMGSRLIVGAQLVVGMPELVGTGVGICSAVAGMQLLKGMFS